MQLSEITPLPEHEAHHSSFCGQSEAATYLTPGIKMKRCSHNISMFLRNQNSEIVTSENQTSRMDQAEDRITQRQLYQTNEREA